MKGGKARLPVEPAPPAFDIFVLGTRSSGKSVLLASLYRQLSSMDGITNFFARCDDPEQHRELCDNYDQLLDTEADWPAGTYRVDSYDMGCFHRLRGKSLPVFSIRFHDYPGGYVSDQVERREFIEQRAEQCNSVMALIDGRKLLDRLEDREDNPAHSLHRDLDSLVRVLQQCVGKPIHFVLTKADLLEPSKYPLRDIVAELKRHKGFGHILAQQREAGASCYLVPVSAIGPNFARLDPDDGLIKKRRNGTIEPFHLDVMTSVSMVDTVLDLVRTADRPGDGPGAGREPWAVRVKRWIGNKLGYARMAAPASFPVFGPLGVLGIVAVTIGAEKLIGMKSRSFEDKVREIRQGITDRTSALEAILTIQYQLLDRFLKRHPAARLGVRFDPATAFAPVEAKVAKAPIRRLPIPPPETPEPNLPLPTEKVDADKPVEAMAESADGTDAEPAPAEQAPVEKASAEPAAVPAVPIESASLEPAPAESSPADAGPALSAEPDPVVMNEAPEQLPPEPAVAELTRTDLQQPRGGRLRQFQEKRTIAAMAAAAVGALALVGYFGLNPMIAKRAGPAVDSRSASSGKAERGTTPPDRNASSLGQGDGPEDPRPSPDAEKVTPTPAGKPAAGSPADPGPAPVRLSGAITGTSCYQRGDRIVIEYGGTATVPAGHDLAVLILPMRPSTRSTRVLQCGAWTRKPAPDPSKMDICIRSPGQPATTSWSGEQVALDADQERQSGFTLTLVSNGPPDWFGETLAKVTGRCNF